METTRNDYKAIVVAQTDKLDRMSRAAVERLGKALKSGRAVKAEAKRFADRVAAHISWLNVGEYDVVGYCNPYSDRPGIIEPIVIEDGKPVRVTVTHIMVAGEYWISAAAELEAVREKIVLSCARKVAEDIFLGDAMMAAIDEADPDGTLSGMSSHSPTCTVTLTGDYDGKIAKRLPRWITVGTEEPGASVN
jgi:hypothetical protein